MTLLPADPISLRLNTSVRIFPLSIFSTSTFLKIGGVKKYEYQWQ